MDEGYTMPLFNSVMEQDLIWHAAKLAEETGEVCQGIVKNKAPVDVALECMDVIQCAENVLRKLRLTPGMMNDLRAMHVRSCENRGYVAEA